MVDLDALRATKLHVPPARRGLVARPRLVDRLTEGLQGELTVGGQTAIRVVHVRVIIGTRAWPLGNVVHGHQRRTQPQKRK